MIVENHKLSDYIDLDLYGNSKKNVGVRLMQVSSHNTNEFSGDATTTSTVIAHSIQKEGLRFLQSGFNPVLIKRGIERACKEIVEFLEDTKITFDYKEEVECCDAN